VLAPIFSYPNWRDVPPRGAAAKEGAGAGEKRKRVAVDGQPPLDQPLDQADSTEFSAQTTPMDTANDLLGSAPIHTNHNAAKIALSTSASYGQAEGTTSSKKQAIGTTSSKKQADGTTPSKKQADGTTSSKKQAVGSTSSKKQAVGTTSSKKQAVGTTSSKKQAVGTTSSKKQASAMSAVEIDEDIFREQAAALVKADGSFDKKAFCNIGIHLDVEHHSVAYVVSTPPPSPARTRHLHL